MAFLLLAVVLLAALGRRQRSPEEKGRRGEALVSAQLRSAFNAAHFDALSDLTLPTSYGTTQIDHVIVAPTGVFVIETKNMSGWIFGGSEQAKWTQSTRRNKHQFQNPLRQNYKHVKAVQHALGLPAEHIHNVVVFVGTAEPKTLMPPNVLWGTDALTRYVGHSREVIFDLGDVQAMKSKLRAAALADTAATRTAHIAERKAVAAQRQDPNRCPKCGAGLVTRTNRKTGETFKGCSRFPKCRGARKS